MNKTLTILKHEFLANVKRRSFIFLTLAFPLIGLLVISGYTFFQDEGGPSQEEVLQIGYVDGVGIFDDYREQYKVSLIPYESVDEVTAALINDELEEYFVIPEDYVASGLVTRYTTER